MPTIGKRIAAARKERQLTQDQLAQLLGVTKQAVSHWEKDRFRPNLEQFIALCGVLNRSADLLLFGDGQKESIAAILQGLASPDLDRLSRALESLKERAVSGDQPISRRTIKNVR